MWYFLFQQGYNKLYCKIFIFQINAVLLNFLSIKESWETSSFSHKINELI